MFAVKIGSTSGKLCYAVDQSLEALKLYKHNQLDNMPVIKSVAIWFVLDRSRHIENEDGKRTCTTCRNCAYSAEFDIAHPAVFLDSAARRATSC